MDHATTHETFAEDAQIRRANAEFGESESEEEEDRCGKGPFLTFHGIERVVEENDSHMVPCAVRYLSILADAEGSSEYLGFVSQ